MSIQKTKGVFAKGYEKVFTEELFKVNKVHTKLPIPHYTLSEFDGKTLIEGRFYENELQKGDYEVFMIERILRERIHPETGDEEIFVKWIGWPEKYNQWISKSFVE